MDNSIYFPISSTGLNDVFSYDINNYNKISSLGSLNISSNSTFLSNLNIIGDVNASGVSLFNLNTTTSSIISSLTTSLGIINNKTTFSTLIVNNTSTFLSSLYISGTTILNNYVTIAHYLLVVLQSFKMRQHAIAHLML